MHSMMRMFKSWVARGIYVLTPRSFRRSLINSLLQAEESAPPREAAQALLEINDRVGLAIDTQCKRWGDGVHVKHLFMDGIHSFFYDRIPLQSNVLDLGCGQGTLADAIAAHTESTILGVDFDAAQIAFAKRRYRNPRLEFMVGNVLSDVFPDKHFDVIVLSSVLEHLNNRSEFLRILTEKFHPTKFLIRVPTFEQHYFKALKRELGMFAFVDPTHVLEYSPQTFSEEMKDADLDIKHCEIRWGDIWAECRPIRKNLGDGK